MARRDHSMRELELKLKRKKFYTPQDIKEAIEWARQQSWMPSEEKLSLQTAQRLHAKRKGIHAINAYLQNKGLPLQPEIRELECEKALALITRKYAKISHWDHAQKSKAARFLASRGYQSSVIQQTLTHIRTSTLDHSDRNAEE